MLWDNTPSLPSQVSHQTILVLDFGSQYTQLIARRLRELSVYSEIVPFNTPIEKLRAREPVGIILSGGPKSVSEEGAPKCDAAVFELQTPVLGICYGMQLMTDVLGGEVRRSGHREFGHAFVRIPSTPSAEGSRAPLAGQHAHSAAEQNRGVGGAAVAVRSRLVADVPAEDRKTVV